MVPLHRWAADQANPLAALISSAVDVEAWTSLGLVAHERQSQRQVLRRLLPTQPMLGSPASHPQGTVVPLHLWAADQANPLAALISPAVDVEAWMSLWLVAHERQSQRHELVAHGHQSQRQVLRLVLPPQPMLGSPASRPQDAVVPLHRWAADQANPLAALISPAVDDEAWTSLGLVAHERQSQRLVLRRLLPTQPMRGSPASRPQGAVVPLHLWAADQANPLAALISSAVDDATWMSLGLVAHGRQSRRQV